MRKAKVPLFRFSTNASRQPWPALPGFSAQSNSILNVPSPVAQPGVLCESSCPMPHVCSLHFLLDQNSTWMSCGLSHSPYSTSHSTPSLPLLFLSMVLTTSQVIQAGHLGAMCGSVLSLATHRMDASPSLGSDEAIWKLKYLISVSSKL